VRYPLTTQPPAIRCRVDRPTAVERRRLWETALGPAAGRNGEELDAISTQYRMSARAICSAAAGARLGDDGALAALAGSDEAHRALDALAQRLDPRAEWDDLVVPAAVRDRLREIAAQVRLQSRVYEEWGLGSKIQWGLAITALFTGESGTGKTLAAEVLAAEIRLPLYRIDLSSVVSKYIGETEKQLRGVFEAAEACGAILLFDEADALFGRRSDVRDSHDRYANIEVSYLLQRIEAYRGLAILTTNAKATIDRAFYRRLRFVVDFPFPDAAGRERIWRAVFPPETPLGDIDHAKLARLNVSGGGIRNIALNAAFRAASASSAVSMAHLLDAARAEFAKAGKALVEAETRGWTSP
jgi:SpoVK/Ycf46/Vps4 family AAA+-type ATPase